MTLTGDPDSVEGMRLLLAQLLDSQAVGHMGTWTLTIASDEESWSPELYSILGRDPATFTPTHQSFLACLHDDDRGRVDAAHSASIASGDNLFYITRVVLPDATERWIESHATPTVEQGTVIGFVGTILDVTERTVTDLARRTSDARYHVIVEATQEGIWTIDAAGVTTSVNESMTDMLGYDADEMLGRPLVDFLDDDGRKIAEEMFRAPGAERNGGRHDFRFTRRDGTDLWTHAHGAPTFDQTGQFTGALAMFADITERKLTEDTLLHAATHDELTGLPNRALLLDRLEVAQARSSRQRTKLAVLYCDLDHFKVVNDSLGHEAGDEVLIAVAQRIRSAVRLGDTVARLGSDEFAVLCEDLETESTASAVSERITESLSEPVLVSGREFFVTMSIGIRFGDKSFDRAADLVRDADAAMHEAKTAGRGGCVVFDASVRTRAQQRLDIESGLHHALERGELRVHYQPTVLVSTGSIVGVEALVRWQHPRSGLQAPGYFIGIAEETGLIIPIGLWVLDEACQQLRAWNDLGMQQLTMSVNLSPRQLRSPDLVEAVAEILARTGIRPADLCLEITESALIQDATTGDAVLSSLKALGLRLAIDDFGTGYSSLSYLRRFPIDVLKIDQSFVAHLGNDAEATAIVTSIVHLAKSLKLETVAEGVEEVEQLAQLELLGCQFAQGYYWSKPLPKEEITSRLQVARVSTPPVPPQTRSKFTVVIADDEAVHRALIRRVLDRSGRFEVIGEALDGQQAIELADRERPDLVILDLSMPKMDGLEALPRILARSPRTRVALLSGHIGTAPLADGASLHMRKGLKPAELVANLLLVLGADATPVDPGV